MSTETQSETFTQALAKAVVDLCREYDIGRIEAIQTLLYLATAHAQTMKTHGKDEPVSERTK